MKEIGRILDIFIKSDGKIRPHFILTGESGSGKSYTIKSLCKSKEIEMLEINAAQITKEGTSGNSLSKALSPIANMKSKKVVVFVDEFDKLFISTNSNSSVANEVTVGVQNEFLKVLESPTTSVYGDYGKYIDIDISKVLFVFAGAFNNEEKVTLDKLRNFGVKTEFLRRVGLIYNTKRLSLEDLYIILENSELLDTYMKIFIDVKREVVVSDIKTFLKQNYKNNTSVVGDFESSLNTLYEQNEEMQETTLINLDEKLLKDTLYDIGLLDEQITEIMKNFKEDLGNDDCYIHEFIEKKVITQNIVRQEKKVLMEQIATLQSCLNGTEDNKNRVYISFKNTDSSKVVRQEINGVKYICVPVKDDTLVNVNGTEME